ncbi:hypothetical protein ACNQFZ_05260 [Schinkia sp. CFF1]
MNKFLIIFSLLFVFASFCFYLLGLMRIVPLFYSAIPMFLSIFLMVHSWNNRNRFRRVKRNSFKDKGTVSKV